ncbi:MAG: hypothetical protein LBN95_10645 [Prevotellaceae bacterium]|jgi:hypothetical protein|nr:hypothetical protein [Prevotellaceae bacterium]
MKNSICILSLAICLIFAGCQNTENADKQTTKSQIGNKMTQKVLFNGNTKYSLILDSSTELLGYLSVKQNSLSGEQLTFYNSSLMEVLPYVNEVRAKSPEKQFDFKINGANFRDLHKNLNNIAVEDRKAAVINSNLFGSDVTFAFSKGNAGNNNGMQKSPEKETDVAMYVPELVQITSPNIETPDDLLPYCYYKNFKLGWNADLKNENGVVVIVEWSGSDMFGKDYQEVVRNIDIIEFDNGEAILNSELFDGMPQGALVKLMLIRGNIELIDNYVNDEGYAENLHIAALSQAILPFILVKEIGKF